MCVFAYTISTKSREKSEKMKNIQAIILAGGYGTRLMPLTESTPKPLMDFFGKSVLQRTIERVKELGIEDVCVTAMYRCEDVKKHIREHFGNGVETICETKPLGTAGAVKNAYNGHSKTILVLSGDGVFDFNLRELVLYHSQSKNKFTIGAYTSENPLEYGVIMCDDEGKIERFCEKPSWSKVYSPLVNTGIYIFDADVLNEIPKDEKYDFSRQLFPKLKSSGICLYAKRLFGYWCDIGTLDDYAASIKDGVFGEISGLSEQNYTDTQLLEMGVDFESPVYIHKSACICKNVSVGKGCYIGKNVKLCDGAGVFDSIVLDNSYIGLGSGIYGSILSKNVTVSDNCVVSEGCVIADGVKVENGAILDKFTHLSGKQTFTKENMMSNFKRYNTLFTERGIVCSKDDPEFFVRLGKAVSYVLDNKKETKSTPRLGIMHDFAARSAINASLVSSGAALCGTKCFCFGGGFEALARYVPKSFACDMLCFVTSLDEVCYVKLYSGDGKALTDEYERGIEKALSDGMFPEKVKCVQLAQEVGGYFSKYEGELQAYFSQQMNGRELSDFSFFCHSDGVPKEISPQNIFIKILCDYGAKVSEQDSQHKFFISPDGTNVSLESSHLCLDHRHMCAILLQNSTENEVFLPDSEPEIYRIIASKKGIKLCPVEENDYHKALVTPRFLYDGVFCALSFAALLAKENESVLELAKGIPHFDVYTDVFDGVKMRASVMEKLYRLDSSVKDRNESEGVKLVLSGGTVTVIPGRASGFKIISEAQSTEAARELCRKIEGIIREQK